MATSVSRGRGTNLCAVSPPEIPRPPWIEWLCHTNFSFLAGASHPEDYVTRAIELGYAGIGITDYDGVYGIVRAHRARRLREKKGEPANLRIFYGAEIHLAPQHHLPLIMQDTVVLMARNHNGYKNLCHLVTLCHARGKHDAWLDIKDLLSNRCDDLLALKPMRGLLRTGDHTAWQDQCKTLQEAMGDRFHLVISRHGHPLEDQAIPQVLQMARQNSIPLLFSQDPYMHHEKDKDLSDLMQAIRMNRSLPEAEAWFFPNGERSLQPLTVLQQRYRDIPGYEQIMQHSQDLASSIEFSLDELQHAYPREMIPAGLTTQAYLEQLVERGLRERYEENPPTTILNLISHELKLIAELRFADYFLTVWDIVRWARSRKILCQGRGSAANSAVCYVLGITSVDPSIFDLLFERFLSRERGDPPDIDVDFEHERREEVIQYIYQRYGRPRAAMVANVITLRTKGALREVGKALGIPAQILSLAADVDVERETRRDIQKRMTHLAEQYPQLQVPWHLWTSLAARIKGFPRHMGIHSGGFVLSQNPINELVPQEPATMEGRTVIQWAKDDIEALGLFKIDVLALGMLTAIRKSFDLIETHEQKRLTLATVPQGDTATYRMIQRADTVGVFQIESRAQMSMLPRLRPRTFYDIVVQVGIIRPGPIQGGLIHPYLKRRHGLESVTYPDPRLEPILERTMGVPIFQEQIMRVAMTVGNFSPGEADELRRQIGAWSLNKDLGHLVSKLEDGMRHNGLHEDFVQQILAYLRGFANYGFPESHAASFALLAYVSSYLKCHHPAAFFAALLNSQPMGFYAPHSLLQAARRQAVPIHPICLNDSEWDCTLIRNEQGALGIRIGFRLVGGLSHSEAKRLVARRQQRGSWASIMQFLKDSPLHRGSLTALAAANALSPLGLSRRAALWLAEAAPFAPLVDNEGHPQTIFAEETPMERMAQDFSATGTTLGDHPTRIMREQEWHYNIPQKALKRSVDLAQLTPNQGVHVFGMVLVRQSPPTAKGMVFFTLEDEWGFINLAFTPQMARKFHSVINRQGFICAYGKLQTAHEGHSILVSQVYEPQLAQAEVIPMEVQDLLQDKGTGWEFESIRNYY